MKVIFNIKATVLALFAVMAMQFCLTACSDKDSSSSGTPVITAVRVCDPEKADSTFTKSSQGQIIAIIGENLNDAIYVYINDQKVYFNPTMNTDHSIIVTVPSESNGFKLTAFNSELRDEIRVETSHGTAVYAFKVLGGYPSITRVQADYPRKTGDALKVYGTNLEAIEKVYFTDIEASVLDTTAWETPGGNHIDVTNYETLVMDHHLNTKTQAYETTSEFKMNIPEIPYDKGSLVFECAAGVAYIAYSKTPGMPVITSISSDMPVLGETLTITGREFVQVQTVTYGDVELTQGNFTVAESEDAITFTVTKVPSEGSNPEIAITTPGGTVKAPFYNYSCLLNGFEGTCADMGWSPNAQYVTNSETLIGGTGTVAHFDSYGQWWGQMCFFSKDWDFNPFTLPGYDVIPADAPMSKIYLAFEVYDNGSDYNNGGAGFQGYIRLELWKAANNNSNNTADITYSNFAWDDYNEGTFLNPDGPVLQDIDGEAHQGKWYRTVIPFTDLTTLDAEGNVSGKPYENATYKTLYEDGISILRFMSFTQGTKSGKVDFFMDNVRIYYAK